MLPFLTGLGTVMYCWMMELLAGKAKTIFGVVPHLNFAIYGLVVCGVAYALPDWRHMQVNFIPSYKRRKPSKNDLPRKLIAGTPLHTKRDGIATTVTYFNFFLVLLSALG